MERTLARRVVIAGLLIGLLAEVVLDGPAFGLNVPVVVITVLAAAWLLRRPGRVPDPLDAWLPIVAIVMASFVAVRGDPFLALLDTAVAILFTGASMVAFSGLPVTRRSASIVAGFGVWAAGSIAWGPPRTVKAASSASDWDLHGHSRAGRSAPAWAGPLGRGLLLGIPVALIFAVLFASADPIFRRGLDQVLGLQIDLGTLPGRMLFALSSAWLAISLLWIASAGVPAMERGSSLGAAASSPPIDRLRGLGVVEALVILVLIDLTVAAFVGLQLAYLFGGLDTLAVIGMTYSDYARRGFFELVAAASLAGAVVVALETTVQRRSRPYIAALLVLVGLSGIVLVSAAMRLRLYQDAYGWTELRLYVLASIVALGAALVVAAGLVLANRTRWLGHGLAVIGVVALVGLNLIAPSAFVAEQNLARVIDPSLVPPDGQADLDRAYLSVLPDDAIPVVVAALPRLSAADRGAITWFLDRRARSSPRIRPTTAGRPGTSAASGRGRRSRRVADCRCAESIDANDLSRQGANDLSGIGVNYLLETDDTTVHARPHPEGRAACSIGHACSIPNCVSR